MDFCILLNYHRMFEIFMIFIDLGYLIACMLKNMRGNPRGELWPHKETFTRFQLADIIDFIDSSMLADFMVFSFLSSDFHRFPQTFIDFSEIYVIAAIH